jgi:pimeloyl-ACP methyl ester carboxylesterase
LPSILGLRRPPAKHHTRTFHAPASPIHVQQYLARRYSRAEGTDADTTWQTRNTQYDAVLKWGTPDFGMLQRLGAINRPVFIANGDDDRMILPWYSHLMASLIPDAFVKLYPDAVHASSTSTRTRSPPT